MTQLDIICVIVFKHRHAPFTPLASIPPRCSRRFCAFGCPHSVVHSMRRRETTEWEQPNETHKKTTQRKANDNAPRTCHFSGFQKRVTHGRVRYNRRVRAALAQRTILGKREGLMCFASDAHTLLASLNQQTASALPLTQQHVPQSWPRGV